jgi:hypothetical protein
MTISIQVGVKLCAELSQRYRKTRCYDDDKLSQSQHCITIELDVIYNVWGRLLMMK